LIIYYIVTDFVRKGSIKDALTRTGSDEFWKEDETGNSTDWAH
jgi:hypothetical protein